MQHLKNLQWFAILALILYFPLNSQAVDWKGDSWNASLNGAIRVSYNDDSIDTETDTKISNHYLSGNNSHIEFTGSRTLKMGINGIVKTEWGLDPTDTGGDDHLSLYDMDQYLGLEGGFGMLRAGTIMTPYMQTGIMMDPYRRDALAARFFPQIQSGLHYGTAKGRGRTTNTLRYDSPISGQGMAAQMFYVIDQSPNNDNSFGTGFTFNSQYMSLFAQWYDNGEPGKDKAYKFGGELKAGDAALFGQYEFDDGLISLADNLSPTETTGKNNTYGADTWHAGLKYTNGKIVIIGQYGQREDSKNGAIEKDGLAGWLAGLSIYLGEPFYIYTGYTQRDFNNDRGTDSRFTLGGTLTF